MKYISNVAEFNFLTQIVVMMYEDPTKDVRSDERFHIEIHFSPGMIIGCNNTEPEGPGFRPIGKMGKSETVRKLFCYGGISRGKVVFSVRN